MRKRRTPAQLLAVRDYARARSLRATLSRHAAFWSVAFTLARRYLVRALAEECGGEETTDAGVYRFAPGLPEGYR